MVLGAVDDGLSAALCDNLFTLCLILYISGYIFYGYSQSLSLRNEYFRIMLQHYDRSTNMGRDKNNRVEKVSSVKKVQNFCYIMIGFSEVMTAYLILWLDDGF